MSYIKNWTFTTNQDPADPSTGIQVAKSFGLALINALIAGGWTCVQSSNGSTLSATNLITSVSSIVSASSGNHSWIILKSPVGFIRGNTSNDGLGEQSRAFISIDWQVSSGILVNIDVHRILPTNGSLTVRPFLNQSRAAAYAFTSFYNNNVALSSTANNAKFHFGVCDTGHFWAALSYVGTGTFPFFIMMPPIINQETVLPTGKLYPYDMVFYGIFYANTANLSYANFNTTAANSGRTAAYSFTGFPSTIVSGDSTLRGLAIHSPEAGIGLPTGPDFNGDYLYSEMYVGHLGISSPWGYIGPIGIIADIYQTSMTIPANGSTVIGSPQTHVCIGSLALPCDVPLTA